MPDKKHIQKIPLASALRALPAHSWHVVKTVLLLAVALCVCVSVVLGAVLIRAYFSPLSLGSVKPYVEDAFKASDEELDAHIGTLNLHWSEREKSFLFQIKNLSLTNARGEVFFSVASSALNISLRHIIVGKFRPKDVLVYSPEVAIMRELDGTFNFGFIANSQSDEVSAAAEDVSGQQDVFSSLLLALGHGEDDDLGFLSALRRFDIQDARFYVHDRKHERSWSVPQINASLSNYEGRGVQVDLTVFLDEAGAQNNIIQARAILPNEGEILTANIALTNIYSDVFRGKMVELDPYLDQFEGSLNGKIAVSFDADFNVVNSRVDLSSGSGSVRLDAYGDAPLSYKGLNTKLVYDARKGVQVDEASIALNGVELSLSGDITAMDDNVYKAGLALRVPLIKRPDFEALWPESLHYVGAYDWLARRIDGAGFHDVVVRSDLRFDLGGDVFDLDDLTVDFEFDDATIDYRSPLPIVKKAKGHGRLDYVSELLSIKIDEASLGGMSVSMADVELAHIIESKHGWADVYVKMSGPLRNVFSMLGTEPVSLDHGYDLDAIEGTADLAFNLQLPTFGDPTFDDAKIDVRGRVHEAKLPEFLKGQDLSVINAAVDVSGNDINIDGTAQFVRQPLSFSYETFMSSQGKKFKERAKVKGGADTAVRDVFGIDLSEFMDRSAAVDMVYTDFGGGKQVVDLEADLQGAHLFVEEFGFDKAVGKIASASCKVDMHDGAVTQISNLNIQGEAVQIRDATLLFEGDDSRLIGGNAPYLRLTDTIGDVSFTVDPDDTYRVEGDFTQFDLRALLNTDKKQDFAENKESKTGLALVASIDAGEILTHENQSIQQGKLYVDLDRFGRFNQLEMDGVAGQGNIYLRYKPNLDGVRVFRFEADDAGATLAAFGLYPNIRGGSILVHAEPQIEAKERNLLGVAEIKDFRVVNAPTLAKILSLASIGGFTDGLANEGIEFERLETQFDWAYRPEGSMLVLENGRTSGAALGLTFDGIVDQSIGHMDVSGTIVPVSQINNLIGSIPLIGDVLTGGSGVFAATYKIEGQAQEPEISINPLSVLAPGIVRRILFE